jgi:hypothetical protein
MTFTDGLKFEERGVGPASYGGALPVGTQAANAADATNKARVLTRAFYHNVPRTSLAG